MVTLSAFSRREVWMPWRESTVMEERLRFVVWRLEGESMTALCREFDIPRKNGTSSSRGTGSKASRPSPVDAAVVRRRQEHPSWGARKLRELLARRRLGKEMAGPARSAGGGHAARGGRLPNDLWCFDFKGEFRLGNGKVCYPIVLAEAASKPQGIQVWDRTVLVLQVGVPKADLLVQRAGYPSPGGSSVTGGGDFGHQRARLIYPLQRFPRTVGDRAP
jgi:hypothetical protein